MSATNSTANYGLPIFVSSDVPSWLTDWNGAMGDIDSAIAAAKSTADSALLASENNTTDITTIQGQINTINGTLGTHTTQIGTISGNINTINSLIGNGTPTTTDQTIIGAINELHADQGNLDDLVTTDKSNLVAAINEVNADLSDLLSSNLTVLYNDTPKNILGGTNITITDDFSKYRTLYVVMSDANTDITQENVSVTTIPTSLLKWYYDNISNAKTLSINATTTGSNLIGIPVKYVDERTIYMQTNSSTTGNIFVHRILGSKLN